MAELEDRLALLERSVAEQQAQLTDLRAQGHSLSVELDVLRSQHARLRESHHVLRESLDLFVAGLPVAPQCQKMLREKAKLLHVVLDHRPALLTIAKFAGGFCTSSLANLSAASYSYLDFRLAVGTVALREGSMRSGHQRGGSFTLESASNVLDEAVWNSFVRFEPPTYKLEEWAKSHTVQAILSCFGVESILGQAGTVHFSDVFGIFSHLGLTIEAFINKFRHVPSTNCKLDRETLEEIATSILIHFSTLDVHGERKHRVMKCRDLFRMLEIIGYSLQRFKSIFPTAASVWDKPADGSVLVLGSYRIRRQIGQGFKGVRCYLGEHVTDATSVAVKLPAPKEEVNIVNELKKLAPDNSQLGLPKLYCTGMYNCQHYIVTELLGSTLSKVLQRLDDHAFSKRWHALRIIGRLLVRRFEALHKIGFVHCDVSPENVLLGRTQGPHQRNTLYLIDFELAKKYPGGSKVEGSIGSAEWSSIRSADTCDRLPEDDLEAIGWMLMSGLYGSLPWYDWLGAAYKDWESKWTRERAMKQVQRAKLKLLNEGWQAFGYKSRQRIPQELIKFIRSCASPKGSPYLPDYTSFVGYLGGNPHQSVEEAESQDLAQFQEYVIKFL